MKKRTLWIVLLCLALMLSGCGAGTEAGLEQERLADTSGPAAQVEQAEAPPSDVEAAETSEAEPSAETLPEDGTYSIKLTLEGGSGKAKIESPATLQVADGKATARVTWSSPNYDYMLVDDQKYLPVNTAGNSVFEIPVTVFDQPMTVIGDTVAMSTPHEVEYTLTFHSDTLSNIE